MKKWVVVLLGGMGLASCSHYTSNGETVYMQSRNGPPLVVPPPLTDSNISYYYNLPAQTGNPRVSIVPPGLNS